MASLPTLCTADASLGRFDFSSLSHQQLMEMLIENINGAAKLEYKADDTGDYLDVCTWLDIECDDDKNVTSIEFDSCFRGDLNIEYIPQTVRRFKLLSEGATGTLDTSALSVNLEDFFIPYNDFSGEVNFRTLPPCLERFNISYNQLTGSVDLTALPNILKLLDLAGNEFSGEVSLTELPACLCELDLSECSFFGSIRLDKLPRDMTSLCLNSNQFSGEIHLENLPKNLQYLSLHTNNFEGRFVLRDVPETLNAVDVQLNKLSGAAVVCRAACTLVEIGMNSINAVEDENGKRYFCTFDRDGHVTKICA